MKSKEEIMMDHCSDNGMLPMRIGKAILRSMDEYADQFRKWRTDPPPKDGERIIGYWIGYETCKTYYFNNRWILIGGKEIITDPDGWIPVPN